MPKRVEFFASDGTHVTVRVDQIAAIQRRGMGLASAKPQEVIFHLVGGRAFSTTDDDFVSAAIEAFEEENDDGE